MAAAAIPSAIQAAGTIYGGIQESRIAGVEAQQQRQAAIQTLAGSQREAEIARKQTVLVQSRQTAVAGASGAGATDETVQNIEAETGRMGEYNALTALYNGQSAAQNLMLQSKMTAFAGKQNLIGSAIGASTIGGQGQTMLDLYGGKLPPWMTGDGSQSLDPSIYAAAAG